MLLSILITSLPERLHGHLWPLWQKLSAQAAALPDPTAVELVSLLDNRTRKIGGKREDLVQIARGDYVAFVDDDDDVSDDYLAALIAVITSQPPGRPVDVITFEQRAIINGVEGHCVFGLHQPNEDFRAGRFLRNAWHVCAWRRSLARFFHFPEINQGEDWAWASQLCAVARTSAHIPRILHTYRYDPAVSAATPGGVIPAAADPFSGIKTSAHIPGWFDFAGFYDQVLAHLQPGSLAIELGTYMGKSAAYFAASAEARQIIFRSFDAYVPDPGSPLEGHAAELVAAAGGDWPAAAARCFTAATGLPAAEYLHRADSAEAASQFTDGTVDFCFIDGDHRRASVERDIRAWLPKMSPFGILAGHDYPCPDVAAAVAATVGRAYRIEQVGRCWVCRLGNDAGAL